jgi:hypothetical protein
MDTKPSLQLDPAKVLEAIVIGGQALACLSDQTKVRRHVPYKQERLVRLVVEKSLARIEDCKRAFPREWNRVQRKRRKRSLHRMQQELFRNMADLAKRINSALAAGFASPGSRRAMLPLTAQRFLILTINHQGMAIGYVLGEALFDIEPFLPTIEDKKPATSPGSRLSPPTSADASTTTPSGTVPKPDDEISSEVRPADSIEVTIDPVSGRWRFTLDGQALELDPIHGYLKVGSQLLQAPELAGLKQPEDLVGIPLRRISSLLDA